MWDLHAKNACSTQQNKSILRLCSFIKRFDYRSPTRMVADSSACIATFKPVSASTAATSAHSARSKSPDRCGWKVARSKVRLCAGSTPRGRSTHSRGGGLEELGAGAPGCRARGTGCSPPSGGSCFSETAAAADDDDEEEVEEDEATKVLLPSLSLLSFPLAIDEALLRRCLPPALCSGANR